MSSRGIKQKYDAELALAFSQVVLPSTITLEMLPAVRAHVATEMGTAGPLLQIYPNMTHEERTVKGTHGDVILSIFRPKGLTEKLPAVYWMHGGGMVLGNRFAGAQCPLEWCNLYGMVCVSVEYRLAPDHPYPAPLEDCYDGLKWVGSNLEELGIDPEKLLIAGQSGGGCLAAGLGLLVRDRGGPSLCAQILSCPMLDSRAGTTSAKLYQDGLVWSGASNEMAWKAVLNGQPADIGLPTTYVDVGSAEIFTDEDIDYAQRLTAAGVTTELHVWGGAFHGFDALLPGTKVAQAAIAMRTAWVGRALSLSPRVPTDAKI